MVLPTLGAFMASHGPQAIGLCSTDTAGCAAAVNAASERLLYAREVGDSGWVGTWSEIAFTVTQADPFITTPFNVARIEALDLCTFPVPISNEFYSYLQFGFGRWPKPTTPCGTPARCAPLRTYDRGFFPLFSDIVPPAKTVRVYLSDPGDVDKRVLLQTLDGNDQPRYSLDGTVQVLGDFLTLTAPFVDSPATVNKVTGIQKDITLGAVTFYEVDTVTGDQRLVLTMQPGETTAKYRRYYVGGVPTSCCNPPSIAAGTVQITALCQLAFVPVAVVTDWLVIPSLEAVINECQCGRYLAMDSANAKQMADYHHRAAIRLLQGQSVHEQGSLAPAVSFKPFGGVPFVTTAYG